MEENKQISAYEYLYATIKTADWISDDYKKFAEKYKDTEEPLKELYLCICDQVSLDVLELVEINDSIADSFRQCRKKHLESDFIRNFSNEMKKIKVITNETKKEVKNMSGTVKQIADTIPTFDEMFLHEETNKNMKEDKVSDAKENIKVDTSVQKVIPENVSKNEVHNSRTSVFNLLRNKVFSWFYCKSPAKYVDTLLKQGYSKDRIEFILECIDDGDTISEINAFASPKIDVELMSKLRKVKKER